MHLLRHILAAILLSAISFSMSAEETDSVIPARISLITCSPGSEVYELCGHTALRVRRGDVDMAVNYGTFDFNAPNFVYRFVKGETDYMVSAYPFSYFLADYSRQGRAVYEQQLNLTAEEADRLIALLEINLRPENRTYRYNYVKDNCSTRPVAMIEDAIGDTLSFTAPELSSGWSFRDAMRNYHKGYPWYQFGIDLALGSGIDYTLSDREKGFAPMMLMEMMDSASRGSDGRTIASRPEIIMPAGVAGGPLPATPWYLSPIAVALLLLAITIAIVCADIRHHRITRWFDTVMFTLMGVGGCIITFLIFISVHEATSPNLLLLWLNPFCLIIPACIYIKKCRRLVLWYGIVNFVAIILLTILWPLSGQSGNLAFIPLILCDALLSARQIYIIKCDEKTTLV